MMRTIYAILGYPLGWIMFLCYHLVNNYGLALILFTILTKLVLVPFACLLYTSPSPRDS